MKPAGLTNPKTGRWPYAAVQLRQENLRADSYNLVGFQNHMKYGDRPAFFVSFPVLRMQSLFATDRSIAIPTSTRLRPHGNTSIEAAPQRPHRRPTLRVEATRKSIAGGLLAGRFAATSPMAKPPQPHPVSPRMDRWSTTLRIARRKTSSPRTSPLTCSHRSKKSCAKKSADKKERHRIQCERAFSAWDQC